MADGGSGGGDGAGAGGNNEDRVTFDGDQTTTSANSNPPPPPANGGGAQATPPPAAPPTDSGAGSGGGSVGDAFGGMPIVATVDGLVGPASGIVDTVLGGANTDGLGGSLPIGSAGTGLVDTLLGGGDGKGLLSSLLGGNALASATTSDQGAHPAVSVDVGGANDGGTGGHSLIDVNADTGSDGALGSVLGNGAGITDLGSLLDGQKLVDVRAGSSQGSGGALVNVNADPASALGSADGAVGSLLEKVAGVGNAGSLLDGQQLLNVDAGSGQGGSDALVNLHADTGTLDAVGDTAGSLLGKGAGVGDIGSLLDGQQLLNVDAGSGQGSSDALVNVHADPSTALGGADSTVGSLLGAGQGVGDLGSVLNGQQLLNVDTGAGDGNGDALVNVHADPGTPLGGTDSTIGSLLSAGDGVGDLGSMLNTQHLVNVSPTSDNGGAGAPINVDTSGIDATSALGDAGGMGLVAALVGADSLQAVDVPLVDTPHEVSVLDAPVADIHLQPDHA